MEEVVRYTDISQRPVSKYLNEFADRIEKGIKSNY